MSIRRACLVLAACSPVLLAQAPADAVYFNGKIVTMSKAPAVAEAVAIREGKFVAVGSTAEVRKLAGPKTRQVDLKGRTVLPGLNDSHTHPVSAALAEQKGPVPVMHSIKELQQYVASLAATIPADQVIFVPKVYATRLIDRRYPNRQELDAAAPGRLVMADNGYASVLSSALLKKSGITRETAQPHNGRIVKDDSGEPTGLILGAPQLLGPLRRTRTRTHQDILWAIRNMQKAYNAVGITSTIDRGQGPDGFRAYQELRASGELSVRTYVTYMISAQGTPDEVRQEIERIPLVTGMGDEWFRVGSLKTVVDGGILIGTAYLREPWGENTGIYGYKEADYRGVLYVKPENVREMARTANRLGWQMTAHTAGGGATDVVLDAYEAANRDKPINGRRFTISHVNFPNTRAIERAKGMGVAFDCQPPWLHLDGPAIKDVFGPERMAHFLPFRSLLDAGVVVAGGSDHMIKFDSRQAINPYNPFFTMWMAITRKIVDGSVLNPEQRINREEALRMWTVNGAYLSFEDGLKGTIEPGKMADLVVISKPFLTCPEDEIKDIKALETVVGGKVVYKSKDLL
ncbi:MAG TPA: amidohydrolase [Bryobacteraceae bacterium]|nr:amidohydrolase [Bryobacteraceae bacterium]